MEFKNAKGIYHQIADRLCERILAGDYKPGEKVPSVREMAAALGVNQNTIVRTFIELQHNNIVDNQRGSGYFVTPGAPEAIRKKRKEEFTRDVLPEFMKQVQLLEISRAELAPLFDQLNNIKKDENK